MRSFRDQRPFSLLLALVAALSSAGCPELNRQPNRSADPLFSVADPATEQLKLARDENPMRVLNRDGATLAVQK